MVSADPLSRSKIHGTNEVLEVLTADRKRDDLLPFQGIILCNRGGILSDTREVAEAKAYRVRSDRFLIS